MEDNDSVWMVLLVAFLISVPVGFTTDLGLWLGYLAVVLMLVGALLVALQAIPMVPDVVPEDITKLLLWLGVTLHVLWLIVGSTATRLAIDLGL